MVNTRNFYFGPSVWATTILVTGGVYGLVEILKYLQKTMGDEKVGAEV
jgi:hypothetical protein